MIDWRKKLASRKFWLALAGLFGAVAVLIGIPDSTITAVSAIISAAGVLAAYILGESMIDASKPHDENDTTSLDD